MSGDGFEDILKAAGFDSVPLVPAEPDQGRVPPEPTDLTGTKVIYAEDARAGMVVVKDHDCGLGRILNGHVCGPPDLYEILEVRSGPGFVSARVLDGDGVQQGAQWNDLYTLRIRA